MRTSSAVTDSTRYGMSSVTICTTVPAVRQPSVSAFGL
jgi:hypothetical protein